MSNLAPSAVAEPCLSEPERGPVVEEMPGRVTDLGGLPIRRLLPRAGRRLVGPWCFFDSYGPLTFRSGKPMDVAPHPHIGLQTVSWLLDGEVLHNDSLGLAGVARPGTLNLMTAGRGIAHAEETPVEASGSLRGVQLWVALPDRDRDTAPAFHQHLVRPLPVNGGAVAVVMGELLGARSSARTFSPLVAADLSGEAGRRMTLELQPEFEHALVPLAGSVRFGDASLAVDALYYLGSRRPEITLEFTSDARVVLLGGTPLGEDVLMWWNFVARSSEEIVAARADWMAGRRFGAVAAYRGERLPAPPFAARPVVRS
jgi:redox-sensitive bicupin YhaK (pirin superfamily)